MSPPIELQTTRIPSRRLSRSGPVHNPHLDCAPVAGNVFLFAAGDGPNWDRTIARPLDLDSIRATLPAELYRFLDGKSAGAPLFAWGAPEGAVGVIAGMEEDDVVFGSRKGLVRFAGRVALCLKDPSDALSTALWGAPNWPYVYFL